VIKDSGEFVLAHFQPCACTRGKPPKAVHQEKCGLDPAAELATKRWPFSLGRCTRSKHRTTKSIRPIAVKSLCCLLYSSSGSTSKKATTRTRMSPGRSCRRRRFGRRSIFRASGAASAGC
jgi:hypothetical protein